MNFHQVMARLQGNPKINHALKETIIDDWSKRLPYGKIEESSDGQFLALNLDNDHCMVCNGVVIHGKNSKGYATHTCQSCGASNFLKAVICLIEVE